MRFYSIELTQEEILKIALEQVQNLKRKESKSQGEKRAKSTRKGEKIGKRVYAEFMRRDGMIQIPIQSDDDLKIICKTAKKPKNKTNKLVRLYFAQQF